MRSNHLKRHMTTHKDILSMSEDDVREELRVRHAVHMEGEKRRQKVEEIAHQESIPIEYCNQLTNSSASTLDTTTLEIELLQGNRLYLDKIELGKQIAAIIIKGVV